MNPRPKQPSIPPVVLHAGQQQGADVPPRVPENAAAAPPKTRPGRLPWVLGICGAGLAVVGVAGAGLLCAVLLLLNANSTPHWPEQNPAAYTQQNGVIYSEDGYSGRITAGTVDPNGNNSVYSVDGEVQNLPPY